MHTLQSRRRFLTHTSLGAAAGLLAIPKSVHAEPPAETTSVRLPGFADASCEVPAYVAEKLLRAEGFTDVRYVQGESGVDTSVLIARGDIDFDWNYAAIHLTSIETGIPITVLAGLHAGCLELIANDSVNSVKELQGKRVAVYTYSSSPHVLVILMAAYVGLDPHHDIQWILDAETAPIDLFIEGKVDAFLGAPPEPQALRAKGIGHTILTTAVDRPWSNYFCCMLVGTTEYVRRYPVATKRVLRALLKAIDFCASQPSEVAEQLSGGTLRSRSNYAAEILTEVRYDTWRDFDPEDTLRFYGLQMRETGLLKSDPNSLIAKAADWRFLNELKRELKT